MEKGERGMGERRFRELGRRLREVRRLSSIMLLYMGTSCLAGKLRCRKNNRVLRSPGKRSKSKFEADETLTGESSSSIPPVAFHSTAQSLYTVTVFSSRFDIEDV